MSESPHAVVRLGAQAVDALPPRLRRSVRSALGGPARAQWHWTSSTTCWPAPRRSMGPGPDEARALLDGIVRQAPVVRLPPTRSPTRTATWAWDLYRAVSGRAGYDTDARGVAVRPCASRSSGRSPTRPARWPWSDATSWPAGHLLECLAEALPPQGRPRRVVEFGPGLGQPDQRPGGDGARRHRRRVGREVLPADRRTAATGPVGSPWPRATCSGSWRTSRYDAAVFFESFHHCADHLAMLRRLHDIVRPGGAVVFASEPIQNLDYAWGPRLDGLSVWSSRTYGWLELGFDCVYFDAALARTGWSARRFRPRGRRQRDRRPRWPRRRPAT